MKKINFDELVKSIEIVRNQNILLEVKLENCKIVKGQSYSGMPNGNRFGNSVEDRLYRHAYYSSQIKANNELLANYEKLLREFTKTLESSLERLIIMLFYFEHLSIKDIALKTQYCYDSIKKKKAEALKKVKNVYIYTDLPQIPQS